MESKWNVLAALSIAVVGGTAGTAQAAITSNAIIQTTGPGPGSNTVTGLTEASIAEGPGPDQNWGISTIGHIGLLAISTNPGNTIIDSYRYSTQITLTDPNGLNFFAARLFLSVNGTSTGNAGISAGAHGSSNADGTGIITGFGIDESNGGPTGIFHGSVPAGSLKRKRDRCDFPPVIWAPFPRNIENCKILDIFVVIRSE